MKYQQIPYDQQLAYIAKGWKIKPNPKHHAAYGVVAFKLSWWERILRAWRGE